MSAKLNAINDIAGYLGEHPLEVLAWFQKLTKAIHEHPKPADFVKALAEAAVTEVKRLADIETARVEEEAAAKAATP